MRSALLACASTASPSRAPLPASAITLLPPSAITIWALLEETLFLQVSLGARMQLEPGIFGRVLGRGRVRRLERGDHFVVTIAEDLSDLVCRFGGKIVARGDVDPFGERRHVLDFALERVRVPTLLDRVGAVPRVFLADLRHFPVAERHDPH